MSADREAPASVYEPPRSDRPAPHEYWDATNQRTEYVTHHDGRKVRESFLTPGGRILVLAYDAYLYQRWSVGIHGDPDIHLYLAAHGDQAREDFARRIAESFGLHVASPPETDAVTLHPRVGKYLQAHTDRLWERILAYREIKNVCDELTRTRAANEVHDAASALIQLLRSERLAKGYVERRDWGPRG